MNERDAIVFVVDDDDAMRRSLMYLCDSAGWRVETFNSAQDFLARYNGHVPGCLVLDVRMPMMSGLGLQLALKDHGIELPVIFLTGHGDLSMAVQAMKTGACDFLEKPCKDQVMLDAVTRAVQRSIEKGRIGLQTRAAQQLDWVGFAALAAGNGNRQAALHALTSSPTIRAMPCVAAYFSSVARSVVHAMMTRCPLCRSSLAVAASSAIAWAAGSAGGSPPSAVIKRSKPSAKPAAGIGSRVGLGAPS